MAAALAKPCTSSIPPKALGRNREAFERLPTGWVSGRQGLGVQGPFNINSKSFITALTWSSGSEIVNKAISVVSIAVPVPAALVLAGLGALCAVTCL